VDFIFEKRAANLIRKYKIAYFYIKISLWILTTNYTKTTFIFDSAFPYYFIRFYFSKKKIEKRFGEFQSP